MRNRLVRCIELSENQRLTVITCNRKSISCYEANVAPIVRLSAHDEVPCSRSACYRFRLAWVRHVINHHTFRIRAFVLLPDHTCLRAARRQAHGIWTCDVKVGHERFNCIGISILFIPACAPPHAERRVIRCIAERIPFKKARGL